MKRVKSYILTAGAVGLMLAGCTKERPYEYKIVDEETRSAKSLIVEAGKGKVPAGEVVADDLYLYLPSTVSVTRTSTAGRPHWMGDAKLVKLKFTKDELQVFEVERDERFGDNPLNNHPVLTIPVRHTEFHCVPDADGKCTNREDENDRLTWDQKKFFELRLKDLQVQEKNFFPEDLINLFVPGCYNVVHQEPKHFDISEDGLNIQIEKTYQSGGHCIGEISSLSELAFKIRYQYSLIKLNRLEDADYKPLQYMAGEENTFGFFTTVDVKLDPDNNTTIGSEKVFVNRWKPNSTVKYYLSSTFNKPENARIKQATVEAVQTINRSLAKAGAGLVLELAEPDETLTEGDLRKNMIVLEEDPLSTGLIGYGPSVANPLTGQIVNGRTVMYFGTIKKYLKEAYDELVIEKLMAKSAAPAAGASSGSAPANAMAIAQSGKTFGKADLRFSADLQKKMSVVANVRASGKLSGLDGAAQVPQPHAKASLAPKDIRGRVDIAKAASAARDNKLFTRGTSDAQGRLQALMDRHCLYSAEMFNFYASIEGEIDQLIEEMGGRMWLELSTREQQRVLDVLLPFVWVPTLVHEMGHNLGLRHNFGGSEDKDNFYTKEELADMGLTREFKYSSVMDYAYRTTNELQVMGKYDIAALRFGYAEQVELENGHMISVNDLRAGKNGQVPPRSYKFCTDEHAGINPNCNRFDEGTTLTEIAQHHIKSYKEKYYRRNFRNNRLSFSVMSDSAYAGGVGVAMDGLRAAFERYENIKRSFGLADNDPVWEQIEFLKDLKTAVKLGAEFLSEVIRTPDLMCAVATAQRPNEIIALVPLKKLSVNAITCFDAQNVQINPAYVIVAQGGKSFQSMKDPYSTNNYIDQIDVRGIWIDKLLALEALVTRETGIHNFDEFNDNLLDVADLAGPVREALEQILSDEVITTIQLVTPRGQVLEGQIFTQLYDPEVGQNGHMIMKPLSTTVQQMFGITEHTPFQVKVVRTLKQKLASRDQELDPTSLLNGLEVIKLRPTDSGLQQGYVAINIGRDVYAAHQTSVTALRAMDGFMVTTLLNQVSPEKVERILADVQAGKQAPAEATDVEKAVYGLPTEALEKFLSGGYQAPVFYAEMIREMAK